MCFCDLTKVFDCVNYELILKNYNFMKSKAYPQVGLSNTFRTGNTEWN